MLAVIAAHGLLLTGTPDIVFPTANGEVVTPVALLAAPTAKPTEKPVSTAATPRMKQQAPLAAPKTATVPPLPDATQAVPDAASSDMAASGAAIPAEASASADAAIPVMASTAMSEHATPQVEAEQIQNTGPAEASLAQPVRPFIPPAPASLDYDVKGVVTFAYTGGGKIIWKTDGERYSAFFQVTKFGFNLRSWTSRGTLNQTSIAPERFGDKGRSSEVAAHFQRDKGVVSFSANTPDAPLTDGAQDQLSAFFQLAGLLAGEPERYALDTLIPFQVVNARGSEDWAFRVGPLEALNLPGGNLNAIKLTREHQAQYDTKVELWLAPTLAYLPVRVRLSQTNGDFAELLWRSSQKPD